MGKFSEKICQFLSVNLSKSKIYVIENEQLLMKKYDNIISLKSIDKFINQELSKQGITNYPRSGYDDLPEAKTTAKTISSNIPGASEQTESLITKSKAKKIDPEKVPAKKFDASKSPGKKYDPKKSPGIRVTDESGSIMNEARQAISSISRSTTLSDEQKEEAIANVRAAAKEEIKKIGLDPDNFSF